MARLRFRDCVKNDNISAIFAARLLFSAILQHQLHGKQIDGKDGNTCLLPHASQLRGERSSCFSSATSWKASSHFQAGTATCCELGAAKRQLQLLLLLLLLIMGSFLRGKHFSKVLHHHIRLDTHTDTFACVALHRWRVLVPSIPHSGGK